MIEIAYEFVRDLVADGKHILFVGGQKNKLKKQLKKKPNAVVCFM